MYESLLAVRDMAQGFLAKHLIQDWYKKFSVWAIGVCLAIETALSLDPTLAQAMPAEWHRYAFLAILVARLKRQGVVG